MSGYTGVPVVQTGAVAHVQRGKCNKASRFLQRAADAKANACRQKSNQQTQCQCQCTPNQVHCWLAHPGQRDAPVNKIQHDAGHRLRRHLALLGDLLADTASP